MKMRLICPNCDAQYEVDDNVIPAAGRDVQCSNCGNTWFQSPNVSKTAAPIDKPTEKPPLVEVETAEAPEASNAIQGTESAPERRKLDDSLADILREEAERETEARKAEADPLESQPDLGLDQAAPAAPDIDLENAISDTVAEANDDELQDRIAQLRDVAPDSFEDAADGPRRDLLPDIEEINSTLSASSHDAGPEFGAMAVEAGVPEESIDQNRGFSRGFSVIILLAAVIVGIYVSAEKLSELAPSLEPFLTQYVAIADQVRLNMYNAITKGMASLTTFLQGINGS